MAAGHIRSGIQAKCEYMSMKFKDIVIAIFLAAVLLYAICSRAGRVKNKFIRAPVAAAPQGEAGGSSDTADSYEAGAGAR